MDAVVLLVVNDRLDHLRVLEHDLRQGAMLGPVVRLAEDDGMWRGPVRVMFVGWLRDLDHYLVQRLPEGLAAVTASLEAWMRDQGPVGLPALTAGSWGAPP